MDLSVKENIYLQREHLAGMLHAPLAYLAEKCAPAWGDRQQLNAVLMDGFASIPHCSYLYCLNTSGVQVSDNIGQHGVRTDYFGRDRSQRPYMKEAVPVWGFLLSDAYISLSENRPSLTALGVVRDGSGTLGYVGADFDLRNLPATAKLYEESAIWRQIKGDPAIRGAVFQQHRIESPMDRNFEQTLSILEELLTQRGVFQCQIHFSSSQVTLWTADDPFRYRILENEALSDPDICLVYPPRTYPPDAVIPQQAIARILETLRPLRMTDENLYLRMSSINIFNGMVSLTFSCDGSHYMRYDEFLAKNTAFWFGTAACA